MGRVKNLIGFIHSARRSSAQSDQSASHLVVLRLRFGRVLPTESRVFGVSGFSIDQRCKSQRARMAYNVCWLQNRKPKRS